MTFRPTAAVRGPVGDSPYDVGEHPLLDDQPQPKPLPAYQGPHHRLYSGEGTSTITVYVTMHLI